MTSGPQTLRSRCKKRKYIDTIDENTPTPYTKIFQECNVSNNSDHRNPGHLCRQLYTVDPLRHAHETTTLIGLVGASSGIFAAVVSCTTAKELVRSPSTFATPARVGSNEARFGTRCWSTENSETAKINCSARMTSTDLSYYKHADARRSQTKSKEPNNCNTLKTICARTDIFISTFAVENGKSRHAT